MSHSDSTQGSPGALALEIRKLAHDLNNALMPIQLGIDVLRRKVDDPALERTLANMERGAGTAAKLVDEILQAARREAPGTER